MTSSNGLTYKAAGVDIEAGDQAVTLMSAAVARTMRPEVVSSLGGFAGLFDMSRFKAMRRPLLATSTDGVGTKLAIAQRLDKHDSVGQDLVAMVADDLVVCGAEPLYLTDYIACGKLVPEKIAKIVAGVAAGCVEAGCTLIGGETAEHPGVMAPDDYDLAGAATGLVEADSVLGRDRVAAGDVLIAMASTGLHSNGYSLVRKVLLELAGWELDRHVDQLGRTLGAELLEPTRIYTKICLGLISAAEVHAFVHITGGGLPGNLPRVLPDSLKVTIDRSTWTPPTIFSLVGDVGGVAGTELERAFNMGVGMIAIVSPGAETAALEYLGRAACPAWVVGRVERRDDASVELVSTYRS
ncbi:phosphoribosylformylglycinamidine cyclo-ligase [Rugosimonospora africana]|uniref:Phosphoribosylformylglycinamidine cyclo-ligase n=1 Tax=Rugosimonospora africana TaxID=556532 RepID=A0A8J3R360_9ACTN|nr:phosphoribosylformylglycinamidine cyclo-ligase [Rugosimonospora africana]GIH20702.1 phosphoribosylformylglycinamidine cyclo-ligase [Rugosimonospora africana]